MLDFGVCFLPILLSSQVKLNPGPASPGNQNSSIFPCGYCDLPVTWDQCEICCDTCDLWFHKNCVDMGSHTFRAFSTMNVSSVDYFQPDCILGTESWLDKSASTNEIFPPGYKIFQRDRITSTQGGGVFIAVKENYDVSLLPDTVTDTELLWAKVHFEKSKSLILGSFYRPPGSKIKKIEEFSRSLDLPKNSNQTIILGGDFNLPDWENSLVLPSATNKGQCEHLLSSLDDHALTQVQKEPTRDKNLLDLCITNKPGLIKASRSVPAISDHCAVLT